MHILCHFNCIYFQITCGFVSVLLNVKKLNGNTFQTLKTEMDSRIFLGWHYESRAGYVKDVS